ncbi:glutathione transferase omega-1 [Ceratocystis lukuohia]|uniref:Glutathione transferase omega-1 n=1 Tax=Ceratocystis lukuohia TaxID=2019550 RepID=A0ABR4MR87_9PEZI
MDAFPEASLMHNAPLLLVTGLSPTASTVKLKLGDSIDGAAISIRSDMPPVSSPVAAHLEHYLGEIDATLPPWDNDFKDAPYRFRTIITSRTLCLPPRKAPVPIDGESSQQTPLVLHSPFSPLSTTSRLYPDGILDNNWLRKHQDLIPSVILFFYSLVSDPNQAQAEDNKLKTDMANIRAALSKSGHKSRLVAVLLSDAEASPLAPTDGITERLENIRKGAGLDHKAIFYVSPKNTPKEVEVAADKILTALYPTAVEYYRDLSRRSKKKRSRGLTPVPTVPPTSGTSQTLSLAHWHVRYDLKIGIFAEFRHDMEAACKAYEQAYESLTSQDVWEMIPGWEPRWNEARFLADITAIRWIRCLLWNGQPSAAVQRWQMHRDLVASMVDRHGRGTNNYGWEAWQARWYLIMAELMEKMSMPDMPPFAQAVYLPPEKTVPSEKLRPWHSLHHTGYWYRAASRHQAARRKLALLIPEDDRKKPEDDPLQAESRKSSKDYSYDTYLCPEPFEELPLDGPGSNHGQLIVDSLVAAHKAFEQRGQRRAVAEVAIECAKELTAMGSASKAVDLLLPLWQDSMFRAHDWLEITEDICWSLRKAAVKTNRGDVVLSVDWEMMSNRFSRLPKWPYDISKSLEGLTLVERPVVELSDESVTPFISAVLLFRHKEARAGETCLAQLQITTETFIDVAALKLTELQIKFEGGIGPIKITNNRESAEKVRTDKNVSIIAVKLEEEAATGEDNGIDKDEIAPALHGTSSLIFKPRQTVVFHLSIPLREPGETQAIGLSLIMDTEQYSLTYKTSFKSSRALNAWYDPVSLRHTTIAREAPHTLDIQPRPPKMELSLITALQQHYTNEPLELELDVYNAEDEDITAKVDVLAAGQGVPSIFLIHGETTVSSVSRSEGQTVSSTHIGSILKSERCKLVLRFDPFMVPTECQVSVKVLYHLHSDPATPILQSMSFKFSPKAPFEAGYELSPRLHPDPWPSMFGIDGLIQTSDTNNEPNPVALAPRGLSQRWSLTCNYRSLAADELVIRDVGIQVLSPEDKVQCIATLETPLPTEGITVATVEKPRSVAFNIDVQKRNLDDRAPALMELAFDIHWTRKMATADANTAPPFNITSIVVPPHMVLGTEPRVLASLSRPAGAPRGLMCMDVVIENASGHFLTFSLTMDPSDQFAFSGPKMTTLNVLPASRRTVNFRLFPMVSGTYIRPALVVKDKYYQKILRVIPTQGMSSDKDGLLIWVPQEAGEERK